ncbi:MAG: phospho-sugar mutase, partial [Planctomycetia bacterium]
MSVESSLDTTQLLSQIETAAQEKKLTPGAVKNIKAWLTEPRYAEYAYQVAQHIHDQMWQELDDAFWTIIPFGTGGRRGKMYPIGSNMINDRTIGESAQGLADYVKKVSDGGPLSCAIAYDSRHRSREFAELCAEIMVAAGFKVWFLNGYRSTPSLSFTVRYKDCNCGIMVTASHNPPSDNAVKAYWSSGVQLLPPDDKGVIDCVMNTDQIDRVPFAEALAAGQIEYCQEEVDRELCKQIAGQSLPGPRDLKILYSPLHGVGSSIVLPALEAAGFQAVETYGPQADPDPDFSNVPDNVSNPERPVVFDAMVDYVHGKGFGLILATDPDADRVGCSAPKKIGDDDHWGILTGNQIGALLTD